MAADYPLAQCLTNIMMLNRRLQVADRETMTLSAILLLARVKVQLKAVCSVAKVRSLHLLAARGGVAAAVLRSAVGGLA